MLIITEKAKRHLKKLLTANSSDTNFGIRLRVGKGMQLGVLLDRREDDDYVVEHEGAKLLIVGPELFPLIDGATLDTEEKSHKISLVITKDDRQSNKNVRDTLSTKGDRGAGT